MIKKKILFLIALTPLIIFLTKSKNYLQISSHEIQYLILLHLFIIIIFLIFSTLFSNLLARLKIELLKEKIFLFFSVSFLIFFFQENLRELLYIRGFLRTPFFFLSIIIIIIIILSSGFAILKNFEIVKKISVNFSITLVLLNFFQEINIYQNQTILKKSSTYNQLKLTFPNSAIKNNIYFVVMDAMSSIEYFNKNFSNISQSEINKLILENNLKLIKNSTSSYNMTYLSLTSILFANYPVTEGDSINDRNIFFPNLVYYQRGENLGIIYYLQKHNNEFKYIGNTEYNLQTSDKLNLSIYNEGKKFNLIFKNIFYKFFQPTPFDELIRWIAKFLFNIKNTPYFDNDSIGKFIDYLKLKKINNKNTFYLIHHFSPHPPFIFDENCNEVEEIPDRKVGYSKAYQCALKKIENFTKFINKRDPNSFLVFIGDHGASDIDHKTSDRFKVITLIKPNKFCANYPINKSNFNTVNVTRLALYCSANEDPILLDNNNYIGYYEDEINYGKIKKINIE